MLFTLRLKHLPKIILCIAFLTMLLMYPNEASNAAKEGFNISLYLVLPSLFPFAVISSYICGNFILPNSVTGSFSKLSGISEQGAAPFLFGIISGYPVGAVLISEAINSKKLTVKEGEHLLPFANAAGPLFMTGVLGAGMFGSIHTGYFLYFVHLSSIILTLVLSRPFTPLKSSFRNKTFKKTSLVQCIEKAMNSMLNVIGCIAFFSVISRLLSVSGMFKLFGSFSAIPQGILELTSGINRLVLSDIPLRLKLSFTSFLCGFSGICILLQVSNSVKNAGISVKKYVVIKLAIAVITFVLTWIFYPLLPVTVPTFTEPTSMMPDFVSSGYGFTLIVFIVYKFLKSKASFFDKR